MDIDIDEVSDMFQVGLVWCVLAFIVDKTLTDDINMS
jgi:hypothetical protein